MSIYRRPLRSDELYHFGIKGMHWGIRRFRDRNGEYTPAGMNRYNINQNRTQANRGRDPRARRRTALKIGAGLALAGAAAYGGYRLHKRHVTNVQNKVLSNYMKAVEFPEMYNPRAKNFNPSKYKKNFDRVARAAASVPFDSDDVIRTSRSAAKPKFGRTIKRKGFTIPKPKASRKRFSSSPPKNNFSRRRRTRQSNTDWMKDLDDLNDELLRKNARRMRR